jgi:protein AaeX
MKAPPAKGPMLKEINLDGIFVSPFALDLFVALLIFLPLRVVFDRWGIQRRVWHRPLFDVSVFVIIVSLLGLANV